MFWLKKNMKLIIILIILIIISLLLVNFRNPKINNKEENIQQNKIKLVNDYSRFYTVDSCVNKYITLLSEKNSDNIYKLLNTDYINNNNINVDNVLNFVDNLDGRYSFSSRKMYYEKIDEYNYKYYIYGYLSKELINDSNSEKIDKYYIINLYTKKMLFDISPYDGKIFKEEK